MSKQYTAGEWFARMVIAPVMTAFLIIATLPVRLLFAWMRSKIWDWFAIPYFHLPHVSVWLMLAAGIFLGTFQSPAPGLKEELYGSKWFVRLGVELFAQVMGFVLAWAIHAWILTGGAR